jgi:hypothetical protein
MKAMEREEKKGRMKESEVLFNFQQVTVFFKC